MLAAKGHEHRTCADGRVKAFGKTELGADIEVAGKCLVGRFKIGIGFSIIIYGRGNVNIYVLFRSVGV